VEKASSRGIRINYQVLSFGADILLLGVREKGRCLTYIPVSLLLQLLQTHILRAECDNLSEVINNQVVGEENYLFALRSPIPVPVTYKG
jgi:hypothetical protein